MSDLFRKEAIQHQGQKLDGEVTIATHMSFNWILALIVAIVVIACSYLFLGEYHRKEVVAGYLQPSQGLSKVYPINMGTIDELLVEEGQHVRKGQLLARVRMERLLNTGLDMNVFISEELGKQKQLLEANLVNQKQLFSVNKDKLVSQIASAKLQLEQTRKQHQLLSERELLSKKRVEDVTVLMKQNFVSQTDYQSLTDSLLALQQQKQELQSRIFSLEEQVSQLEFENTQLPIQEEEALSQLQSQLANINQQLAQAVAQQSFEVRSLRDGIVSNLQIKPGMVVQPSTPVMTILPANSDLEAVLFVPTRAYGFVQTGQSTRIRYQAFPYQRFGIYEGEIVKVSKSILLPTEATVPVRLQEPVYQVIVKLDSQNAKAYGASVPLQAGMLLEADIMVDSRTLFEWLFEPFYSMKGAI
ncbi:HlyD family secretion protein [Pseudoalteromonas xiamenensis]|uniref:HlyD family efflux transporter periplasmic adaptor subunit n=1 Tax=Pseudoalteromonas xiamenensis TaxID=882626 RepID=A0A975DFI3_9GAMM|nr:HlyD family efflux transporter periplasmic adaptor subunit [Pseudoalteromonas xiamenensis]QTH70340.1 HlyD family efflux transporter periplasmic adaptor subunit [Pseudoalteromonas xiamenensis]